MSATIAPVLRNPYNLKVGDKLVYRYYNTVREMTVQKVGLVWAIVELEAAFRSTARVSMKELRFHSGDRQYGRVYLSEADMVADETAEAEAQYLDRCWRHFCENVTWYRKPDGVTLEALKAAADALRIELPTPHPQGAQTE